MKKIWFVICLLVISFAAKAQPSYGLSYGECHKVISVLQESLKNDSVAVAYFIRNYKILNWSDYYLKKGASPSEIIKYFQKDENKKIICIHKQFYQDKVLLMDTSNLKH